LDEKTRMTAKKMEDEKKKKMEDKKDKWKTT
jgi:hypothetical protein